MSYYSFFLGLSILPLVWRLFASVIVLNRFCKDFHKNIKLILMYPDVVGGLHPLRDVALTFHFILLLPILTYIVSLYFWGLTQSTIVYAAYFILLTIVFFIPFISAHDVMEEHKDKELHRLSIIYNQLTKEFERTLKKSASEKKDIIILEKLEKIRIYYKDIENMPLWPLDATILRRFAGSILIPLLFLILQVYVFV